MGLSFRRNEQARARPVRSTIVFLMLCIMSLQPLHAEQTISGDDLLVMLQADDLAALTRSVEEHGATITHHLPIIGALGAQMTADQLADIKQNTPGIKRVIDDLAWEPNPQVPSPGDCPLSSSIELVWKNNTARWTLFNKTDAPMTVSGGEISWPGELGRLASVHLNSERLNNQLSSDSQQTASWRGGEKSILAPGARAALLFEFENTPAAGGWPLQKFIKLEARAENGCSTELVPSYDAPTEDSYYASVSGASFLHRLGITGDGITVAVLDSGLWEDNNELALDTQGRPRVIARYSAITGKEVDEAFDESGHGTHMSSVLARSSAVTRSAAPQPSYRGIAPDVNLVAVKAFGKSGQAGFLDIVRGVQWIVDNRERLNIRVLNLSFAARPRWPYWEDPVNQALMQAWKAGIFIAAAAGNEGPEPMTVGSPGNLPYLLTVGAVTDNWTESDRNDDYIPDFSSRGPTPMGHIKPDLVAMGGHIAGIIRPGSTLARQLPEYLLNNGEFVMTGTSQATALVSGLAALILQVEPGMSNDDLKCMLLTSTEPAIDVDGRYAYSPFAQGKGMISLQRALTLGKRQCQQASLDLDADIDSGQHFQGPAVFEQGTAPYLPGQTKLISDKASEKGLSTRRRWGVTQHLERLESAPIKSPIDWLSIYAEEQHRISDLAADKP